MAGYGRFRISLTFNASSAASSTTFYQLILVFFVVLLFGDACCVAAAAAAAATALPAAGTVPANVGVILDLATGRGKKSLVSMEMALEDFYAAHPSYTTRVKFHVRDSNRDVVTATSAAIDLIDNEKVGVVIGPQSTLQAEFLAYLANKTKVPVITFAATGDAVTQYQVPYFLRACVKDSFQAVSIAAFVKTYAWKNVVLVYEDTNYGVGILPSITDALEAVDSHVINRSAIPPSASNYDIDAELYKLMTMQTRVFIVHMLPARASRLFARASAIGMMAEGFVWIVTEDIGIVLDVLPQSTIQTMLGVVGFRPYVANSVKITGFIPRFVSRFKAKYHQDADIRVAKPTIFQYWAYDVAWAVASAIVKAKRFRSLNLSSTPRSVGANLVDDIQSSPAGPELLSSILHGEFDGLAGRFRFVDRHLPVPIYEIVNVIVETVRGIGFWSPGYGLSSFLNASTSHGKATLRTSVLSPVIWPGDSAAVPKGWDFPVNAKILQIGVPLRQDFKVFVDVETSPNSTRSIVTGYSIDVFEAAVKKLPYALRYEYHPYDCANSYDRLVSQVYFKKFDAAVGDVTIVANRTRYVDFTMPYTESGVSMLVLAKNDENKPTMWIFLEPLTKDLWIATIFFIFFTGLVIWMIEMPKNDKFQGKPCKQFSTSFYFAFSTLTFTHDQSIKSIRSKVVVVSWCFVVLVLVQSYTASLSSMLTAQRLRPSVTDPGELLHNGDYVGYQDGSFVHSILRRLQFDERKIKVYSTQEEYANALRLGSKHGGVSAIFDEIPYISSFLSQYGKDFQMVGPIYKTDGFGFVFPKGSPLVEDFSNAILNLTEGSEGFQIEKKWFRDPTPSPDYGSPDTGSSRLSFKSFRGLFLIYGLVSSLMILINFVYTKFIEPRSVGSGRVLSCNGETASDGVAQPSQNGVANNYMPADQSLQIEIRTAI